jgi:ketosteroid isomerase-like protein
MKIKPGVNIVFFVFIVISILTISCSKSANVSFAGMLKSADSAFSAMSEREGMHKAFLEFIADSGLLMRDNNYPIEGRGALAEAFSAGSDTSLILTWEPRFEKIARSNDLGYTWGVWKRYFRQTGEITRGTYLTIWQLQPDGKWKFILDVGTQGLPE